jgi:hypothetical protein
MGCTASSCARRWCCRRAGLLPHRRRKHKQLLDQLTADEPLRRAASPVRPLPPHTGGTAPLSPRSSTASSLVRTVALRTAAPVMS